MTTRRSFLRLAALAGASFGLPLKWAKRTFAEVLGGNLDPSSIPKYTVPLLIPPAMPRAGRSRRAPFDYYEIAVRQFQQYILPQGMGLPPTTAWGYGSIAFPGTVAQGGSFNYPSFTIEARHGRPVRVNWINGLVKKNGHFLPHILPVDQTLHWANPPGGLEMRDMRGIDPTPYRGPVPIVTHVHGAHAHEESDGYPEAWFLPAAKNIPRGYATTGTWYDTFAAKFRSTFRQGWDPGAAVFQYPNDQRASTLWYHDHTLGMTRLNVYAGPAGFYLLRGGPNDLPGGVLPGPAPALGDPPGLRYHEIPIAIQDRSFNSDGSLFFPSSRQFFDDFEGPYVPDSDISPIWNPEFFGNTMVVNGRTWPELEVEPRRYRFRLLNGCNARFLVLKMVTNPYADRPTSPALAFWQIGSEGGFLPVPVELGQLLLSPAERADVIVDFTGFSPGTEIYLINEGPDEPFGGFDGLTPSDIETTGQVMKFKVVPLASVDPSTPPELLTLPSFVGLGPASVTRKVSLNEEVSEVLEEVGPREAVLGSVDDSGNPVPKLWMDDITENPALGATEIWEIYNFTADAHPIHIHEVQFQVVNRQGLETDGEGMSFAPAQLVGSPTPPETWEAGYKDTVIAFPGQVTRIKAKFDLAGLYVWHCHIVDHEDNEMMRPYRVGP